MELLLTRSYFPRGTNGTIKVAGSEQVICRSIELPWKNNQRSVSCIPEGRYGLRSRFSQRFGLHLMLDSVKDRSLILVHPANDAVKELRGCIAPVTTITGEGKGSYSARAFNRLMNLVLPALNKGPVFITIKKNDHDD